MKKQFGKVTYDTAKSTLIKKYTYGVFGDSKGYEETLYQTEQGNYFVYQNGGCDSIHPTEKIERISKKDVQEWEKTH